MNALEQCHRRPLPVHVLDRCDECGELKEDVWKHVNYWPNVNAVCSAKCFAEMTEECIGPGANDDRNDRDCGLVRLGHSRAVRVLTIPCCP
jgi:hypothetical protein